MYSCTVQIYSTLKVNSRCVQYIKGLQCRCRVQMYSTEMVYSTDIQYSKSLQVHRCTVQLYRHAVKVYRTGYIHLLIRCRPCCRGRSPWRRLPGTSTPRAWPSSTNFSCLRLIEPFSRRLWETNNQTKLVLIVRNPVDRLVSDYNQFRWGIIVKKASISPSPELVWDYNQLIWGIIVKKHPSHQS